MKKFFSKIAVLVLLFIPALAESSPIVAWVNGVSITLETVDTRIQAASISQSIFSTQSTELTSKRLRLTTLEEIIQEEVLLQQADKLGINLDDTDLELINQRLHKILGGIYSYVQKYSPGSTDLEQSQYVDSLLSMAGLTKESLIDSLKRSAKIEKLKNMLANQICQLDDETLKAAYEDLYHKQKITYVDNPTLLEADLLANKTVIHRPYDLKLIQKAEFSFDSLALQLMRNLKAVGDEKTIQEMREDQIAILMPKLEQALLDLANGKISFSDLLESLVPGSGEKINYYSKNSPRFDTLYQQHANVLTDIGDISAPFPTNRGIAILYLAGVLPAIDKVPLIEVQKSIEANLLQATRQEHINDTISNWIDSADIIRVLEIF